MVDQKTIDYIKNSLARGVAKETLYQEFIGQGFKIEDIQGFFALAQDGDEKEEAGKKTIRLILVIGAVLIGAGIFSFIAANWKEMDRPIKIFIIVAAMIVAYVFSWYFKEKENLPKTGEALIILGAIIYGGGIFLIAQMFNIRTAWPDGFILWMIGVLVMAMAIGSYPLFYLSITLGLVAFVGYPIGILESFGGSSWLLTSSLLLLIAAAITFTCGWAISKRRPPEFKDFY